MSDKLVTWEGDKEQDLEESSYFGEDPKEHEKEPFSVIARRAFAKNRDGEPLSPKEKWALRHSVKDPTLLKRTGPRKQTTQNLEQIVKLQLEEGLSYSQIADRLGKAETTIAHLVSRYPNEYRKALDKVQKDLLDGAKITKTVVYSRIIQLMQRLALRAPIVLENIMEDDQQPGGVRMDAVKTALKSFGVGEKDASAQSQQAYLNVEQVQLIKDTIGIFQKLQEESGKEYAAEAEIISDPTTQVP